MLLQIIKVDEAEPSVRSKMADHNSESKGRVFTRIWKLTNYYLKHSCYI